MKTREEKEVLEHFAGVVSHYTPSSLQSTHLTHLSLPPSLPPQFTMMSMGMFKEIFKEMVEYLVDRIETNYALQIIPNSFLANPTTSPTFAAILLNFLLKRMENMGGGCGQ